MVFLIQFIKITDNCEVDPCYTHVHLYVHVSQRLGTTEFWLAKIIIDRDLDFPIKTVM